MNRIVVRLAAAVAALAPMMALAEPAVTSAPVEGAGRPGEPFALEYVVSWAGAPGAYRVLPPELPQVAWGELEVARATARETDDGYEVVFTVLATAREPGEHRVPELAFSISSPEDLTPPEAARHSDPPPSPVVHPQLRADPQTLRVSPTRALVFVSGGLGALLLFAFAGGWALWKRTPPPAVCISGPSGVEAARLALYEARRHRLDGALYQAYSSMAAAVGIVAPENPLKAQLDATAREVGYRGARPPEDQVEADLRAVERAVRGAPPL